MDQINQSMTGIRREFRYLIHGGWAAIKNQGQKTWVQLGVLFSSALVILWPILSSAFSADDTFDSFIPFQLSYNKMSPWTFINDVTNNWKLNQGRFFPGAVTISTFAHYFFPGRSGYKALQLVFALIALMMFFIFIRTLTRSHHVAIMCSFIALGAMQFKVQYDPLLQFSLQQPALIITVFTAAHLYVLGIRRSSFFLLLASALSFGISLLTYETSVLLWPIFIFILISENPEKWKLKLVGATIAPLLAGLNLAYLRSQVVATAPGYTSNFDVDQLLPTFGKQLIASMPMSYSEINSPAFLRGFPDHLQFETLYWWIAVIGAFVISILVLMEVPLLNARTRISLIGVGLTLWITPAFVVAQTVRWQEELVLGNGYITAYQGYFGFALVVAGSLLEIKSILAKRNIRMNLFINFCVSALIFTSMSSVATNNRLAAAQYKPGFLWTREHFEKAVEAGTFNSIEPNSILFSSQPDWWFNPPFIEWFGGPHIREVINPRNNLKFDDCATEFDICKERYSLSYAFNTYGIFPTDTRATVVGRLNRFIVKGESFGGTIVQGPSVFVEYPSKSSSIDESISRCRSWLSSRLGAIGTKISPEEINIRNATVSSCNASLSLNLELDLLKFEP